MIGFVAMATFTKPQSPLVSHNGLQCCYKICFTL